VPVPASADEFEVSHFSYDSEYGWLFEMVRPGQLTETDGSVPPDPNDVPAYVRQSLIDWLRSATA
jgi:hypothetical protein